MKLLDNADKYSIGRAALPEELGRREERGGSRATSEG
jgi:hypothetical protein